MGMYDDVKFEMPCPNCKTKMNNFQSKDGICLMNTLNFWEVNRFYESCSYCNTWVEFLLKLKRRPNRKLTIKDYKKVITIPTKKEQEKHRRFYQDLFAETKDDSGRKRE